MHEIAHIRKPKTISNSIIVIGIIAVGLIIVLLLGSWKYSIDQAHHNFHNIEELQRATMYVAKMRQNALNRTSLLNDMRSNDDPFDLDRLNQEMSFQASKFMVSRDKLLTLNLSPEIRSIWQDALPEINRTGKAQQKVAQLFFENKSREAELVMLNEAFPYQSLAQKQLSRLLAAQKNKTEHALQIAHQNKQNTYYTIISIGTISLLLTISIMIRVFRMVKQTQVDLNSANEAKIANQMKSDFLATMSHEIRTPLAAIIGYAESSLQSNQSKHERLEGTQRIIHNSNYLLELINDILDLSKIESGRFEIENTAISPIEIVNDVYEITKVRAEEKHLKFEANFAFPLPKTILGDATRIKQILINLMSNAIKFTEKGHVSLNISFSQIDGKIYFEVEDTGIGFTDEQHKKIFNAFIQADTSTTRKYGGTGLGLALTKNLVDIMKGQLAVESKPGVGSRFAFSLNTGKIYSSDLTYTIDKAHVNSQASNSTTNMPIRLQGRVLLVEDNIDNQRLLSRYMLDAGLEVKIANNGANALEVYPDNKIDLVIMDMQMPIMDGPTATIKLRESGCTIPIVALTANAYKEDREKCLAAGCNDFATKPVRRSQLIDILSNHLKIAQEEQREVEPITSNLLDEEPEFINLIQDFVDNLERNMLVVRNLLSNEKWDELKSLIHEIKGSASSFGYPQLTKIASRIEFQLTNDDITDVSELANDFESLVRRIVSGIEISSQYNRAAN